MSSTTPRDHFNPDDPLYFAPPRLRRGPDFPLPPAPERRSDRPRSISSAARFDALVEEAIADSLRPSPTSETAPEPRAFVFERDQQRGWLGVAVRVAAAIGASAVIAFFFVVVVPMAQRSDPPKPALTEIPAVVTSAPPVVTAPPPAPATLAPRVAPEDSEALLQKFMQWRLRDSWQPKN